MQLCLSASDEVFESLHIWLSVSESCFWLCSNTFADWLVCHFVVDCSLNLILHLKGMADYFLSAQCVHCQVAVAGSSSALTHSPVSNGHASRWLSRVLCTRLAALVKTTVYFAQLLTVHTTVPSNMHNSSHILFSQKKKHGLKNIF